jgi:integrase
VTSRGYEPCKIGGPSRLESRVSPRRPRSKVPGLVVVRGPHKDEPRVWYWRFRRGAAGSSTLWTGWATKLEAERTAYAILADPDDSASLTSGGGPQTVRQLLRLWGRHQDQRLQDPHHPDGSIRPRTATTYRSCARRVARSLGDIDLRRVDARELRRFAGESRAPVTIRLDLTILAAAWSWGRRRGLVPQVDLAIPHVAVVERVKYTPSPGDVAAVLTHLEGRNRLAVKLMAATGARSGEIAHLTWDRVDLTNLLVTLVGKTGSRDVPISEEVADALYEAQTWRRHRGNFVLGATPLTVGGGPSGVGYALKMACHAANVRPFAPQALRRLASSRLLAAGVPPLLYEHVMGHSFKVARKHYATTSETARRDALALLVLPRGEVVHLPARDIAGGRSLKSDTSE